MPGVVVATFSGVVSGGAVVVVVFSAGGRVAAPTERVNQVRCWFHDFINL